MLSGLGAVGTLEYFVMAGRFIQFAVINTPVALRINRFRHYEWISESGPKKKEKIPCVAIQY